MYYKHKANPSTNFLFVHSKKSVAMLLTFPYIYVFILPLDKRAQSYNIHIPKKCDHHTLHPVLFLFYSIVGNYYPPGPVVNTLDEIFLAQF